MSTEPLPMRHPCPDCGAVVRAPCTGPGMAKGQFHKGRRKSVQASARRKMRQLDRSVAAKSNDGTRAKGVAGLNEKSLLPVEVQALRRRLDQLGIRTLGEYLGRDHWKRTREGYYDRNPRFCYVCGSDDAINLHHHDYSTLGRETDHDLTPLCRRHHEDVHVAHAQGRVPLAEAHVRVRRKYDVLMERRPPA